MNFTTKTLIIVLFMALLTGQLNLYAQTYVGNFPLFEGFETENESVPAGWLAYVQNDAEAEPPHVFLSPTDDKPNNRAIRFHQKGLLDGEIYQYLRIPCVNLSLLGSTQEIVLSFDAKTPDNEALINEISTFKVLISQYPDDSLVTANVLDSISLSNDWTNVAISLAQYQGQSVYLYFLAEYQFANDQQSATIFLDNVFIRPDVEDPSIISTFPYLESFEHIGVSPGWSVHAYTGDPSWSWENIVIDEDNLTIAQSGNSVARGIYSCFMPSSWLISPQFQIPNDIDGHFVMEYFLRCYSPEQETVEALDVRISTTDSNLESFDSLSTEVLFNHSENWEMRTIDLSEYRGQEIYIAFVVGGTTRYGYVLIDSFYIGISQLEFLPPKNLSATMKNDILVLSWEEPDIANNINLTGYTILRGMDLLADNITGLDFYDDRIHANECYQYFVYANYSNLHKVSVYSTINVDINALNDIDEELVEIDLQITNYPNPFNPETTISFTLSTQSDVSLDVYNIRGQRVKSLLNDNLLPGDHQIIWDGTDDYGQATGSGVYFYTMRAGDVVETRRMVLMK